MQKDLRHTLNALLEDFLRESLYELYEKDYLATLDYWTLTGTTQELTKNYIEKQVTLKNLPMLAKMSSECFVSLREGK